MKRSWLWVCTLLALLMMGGTARAEEFLGVDARAYAMGDAYTVLVDDATALFWNPAALAEIGRYSNENSSTSTLPQGSDWFTGLIPQAAWGSAQQEAYNAGDQYANPLDYLKYYDDGLNMRGLKVTGTTGFAIGHKMSLVMGATSERTSETSAILTSTISGNYSTGFAVGNWWDHPFGLNLPFEKFAIGWGLHADIEFLTNNRLDISETYTPDFTTDPTGNTGYYEPTMTEYPSDSRVALGPGLDLGLLAQVNPMVKMGLVTHNLLSLGYASDGGALPLTRDFRVGVAFTPPIMGMKLAAEVGSDKTLNTGIEIQPLGKWLSLRGGMVVANGETEMRGGFGLRLGTLRLDVGAGKQQRDLQSKIVTTAAITF